jgi:hypothetical protein
MKVIRSISSKNLDMRFSDTPSYPDLEAKQKDVLRDLARLRVVTPIQFEVSTRRVGQNTEQTLKRLVELQLAELYTDKRGETMFNVSALGLRVLRQLDLNSKDGSLGKAVNAGG